AQLMVNGAELADHGVAEKASQSLAVLGRRLRRVLVANAGVDHPDEPQDLIRPAIVQGQRPALEGIRVRFILEVRPLAPKAPEEANPLAVDHLVRQVADAAPAEIERQGFERAELPARKSWVGAVNVPQQEKRYFANGTSRAAMVGRASRPVISVGSISDVDPI